MDLSDSAHFSQYFLNAARSSTRPEIAAVTHLSDSLLGAGRPAPWFNREKYRTTLVSQTVPDLDTPTGQTQNMVAAGLTISNTTPRGSTAGLRSGKSTYIQPAGTGYDNPALGANVRQQMSAGPAPVSMSINAMRPYTQNGVLNTVYNMRADMDTKLANLI